MHIILPSPHSEIQKVICNFFLNPDCRELVVCCGTKFGKAVKTDTIVPTPDRGYIPISQIKKDDFVFDEHGNPTKVVYATDFMYGHDCYEMTFSDGTKVVADAEHDWITTTHRERRNIARGSTTCKPNKRNSLEIFNTQKTGSDHRPNHAIENVTSPLKFNGTSLPIPPYTLGVWLGDGTAISGAITNPDEEIINYIRKDGFNVHRVKLNSVCPLWRVENLTSILKKNGLLGNKHIPAQYLIAKVEDRISLLQGLMDTDGTIDKNNGYCTFDNTNKNIADSVAILAQSLGIKVMRSERIGRINGVDKKLCYRVWFKPNIPIFKLKRKLNKLKSNTNLKSRRRTIVSVEKVQSVPVMCIQVENPSHLFLITEACIPTHNSISASVALSRVLPLEEQRLFRWIAPYYSQSRIGQKYIKKLLPSSEIDPRLNPPTITMPKIDSAIQFFHGTDPEALEGEAIHGQVIDEASKLKEDVYNSAYTTTTQTRGKTLIISTPNGKNWFYKKAMSAMEEMLRAKHENRYPTKMFLTAPTSANPFVPKEAIEEAKNNLPKRLFEQYYLAKFIEDSMVFNNVHKCIFGPLIETYGNHEYWLHSDASKSSVVIGVDWAKTEDRTVFVAIDISSRKVVGFERFYKKPYTEAIRLLVMFSRKFQSTELVMHDKTGVGSAIDDQLAYTDLNYKGFIFTNASKTEGINRLITSQEQGLIMLPNWQPLISEFESFEVTTNKNGNMIYSAPSGQHDDIVCATMLAHIALLEYTETSDPMVRFLEDLPRDKLIQEPTTVEDYYNQLIGDNDDDD